LGGTLQTISFQPPCRGLGPLPPARGTLSPVQAGSGHCQEFTQVLVRLFFLTGSTGTEPPLLQCLQLSFLCLEQWLEPAHHNRCCFPDESHRHAQGGFLSGESILGILVASAFGWCTAEYGSKPLQRQKCCVCCPGARVTGGWQDSRCDVLKGRVGVQASRCWHCVVCSIGSGVSSAQKGDPAAFPGWQGRERL